MLDKTKVDFELFGSAVRDRFDALKEGELYTTDVDPDEAYTHYLASFPDGTNNIFRERAEHDCSCCKNFIRNLGGIVGIVDGVVQNVWQIENVGWPYDAVAAAMAELVSQSSITGIYRTKEGKYGAEVTPELNDGEILKWTHFSGSIARDHQMDGSRIGPHKSDVQSSYQVLSRGLDEITPDAIAQTLELIDSDAIYRGAEFRESVAGFSELQSLYIAAGNSKEVFLWKNINHPSARFRNTAIGTLLTDLSTGVELEPAVKMFESKVAPENYKRPKSLITPRMIDKAIVTLDDLGLRKSIERRHATVDDVSVRDVLFVDNSIAPLMKDSLSELLMQETSGPPVNIDSAAEIPISEFVNSVLPDCTSLDLLFSNECVSNLMTLTAPVHGDAKTLFKWGNGFAWSYNGDMADSSSIKKRVKSAGGNVDAALRVSLAWFNGDDLDIHMIIPRGNHIFYNNKMGILDVDMNAAGPSSREPVENMQFVRMPEDGAYQVMVHNYERRESIDVGFDLELAIGDQFINYSHKKPVGNSEKISCLVIHLSGGNVVKIEKAGSLMEGSSSQEHWGIQTQNLIPVDLVSLSPNHWGTETGNKHWFFFLRDCKNPEPVRGIYNEYLNNDMNQHRKVLEVLASKTKAPYQDSQMSGLGFSSTKRQSAIIVAKGKTNRAYKVQF